MTTTHENPPQPTEPNNETIRNLAKASLNQLDDSMEDNKDQVDQDLDAFELAEETLFDAKQLVPDEYVTVENLDVIISNVEKLLPQAPNEKLYDETIRGLNALEEARNRLENGSPIGREELDAIFDNYNDLARDKKPANTDTATQSEIEYARKDVISAIYQMNNDIEAYKYLATILEKHPELLKKA